MITDDLQVNLQTKVELDSTRKNFNSRWFTSTIIILIPFEYFALQSNLLLPVEEFVEAALC